jgi:hypothetical protein
LSSAARSSAAAGAAAGKWLLLRDAVVMISSHLSVYYFYHFRHKQGGSLTFCLLNYKNRLTQFVKYFLLFWIFDISLRQGKLREGFKLPALPVSSFLAITEKQNIMEGRKCHFKGRAIIWYAAAAETGTGSKNN